MTNAQYEALKNGQMVRHKGGKLYKVTFIEAAADDVLYRGTLRLEGEEARKAWADGERRSGDSFRAAHGLRISFTQWQVNEKHPEGRYYQASKNFDADKVELV